MGVLQCGDGVKVAPEECDDGNEAPGDGCDEQCKVESGWSCSSGCAPICGDSKRIGTEACDDGNQEAGDGCSGSCQVEQWYVCTGGDGSNPVSCTLHPVSVCLSVSQCLSVSVCLSVFNSGTHLVHVRVFSVLVSQLSISQFLSFLVSQM